MLTVVLFLVGIAFLIGGAEGLVRGASRLAVTAGISPLVVGLTVVAFGTSSPELAVTVSSATSGDADIAIGNVVGSNIFNILLILGVSAMVAPLVVSQRLVRLEVPLMIGVSLLALLFALDGRVSRVEGAVLAGGVVTYTAWAIWRSRREQREIAAEYAAEFSGRDRTRAGLAVDAALVAGGLALLVVGSNWFVDGAVDLAEALGVSKLVIGLTIVSAGTSMPEVATSIMASLRGERDIAVGNVVGSNLFNILAVLGVTSVVSDSGVAVADAALRFDIPVMVATAVACLPIFFTGWTIARWEGALFLGYYAAYTLYLLLDASGHEALPAYSVVMIVFVVPITAVTLAVLAWRHYRLERVAPAGEGRRH